MTMTGKTVLVLLWLGCAAPSLAAGAPGATTVQEECDDVQRLCRTECTATPGTAPMAADGSVSVAGGAVTACREVCEDVRDCSATALRAR